MQSDDVNHFFNSYFLTVFTSHLPEQSNKNRSIFIPLLRAAHATDITIPFHMAFNYRQGLLLRTLVSTNASKPVPHKTFAAHYWKWMEPIIVFLEAVLFSLKIKFIFVIIVRTVLTRTVHRLNAFHFRCMRGSKVRCRVSAEVYSGKVTENGLFLSFFKGFPFSIYFWLISVEQYKNVFIDSCEQ